jgi:Nucleotidyl transferase AbiEii toxin, Type IV TA system
MIMNRSHHREIWKILAKFDREYLTEHSILFGGGTRIAMELNEYRESIDIDFLCAESTSCKAVRSQITSTSLGRLLRAGENITFAREIRFDRDAARAFVVGDDRPIKLEFVHCDYYDLKQDERSHLFPVPFIDQTSCFFTKLLANADRYAGSEKKDLFDLCMMQHSWGAIPENAWAKADEKYGLSSVYHGLESALGEMAGNKAHFVKLAVDLLSVEIPVAKLIVNDYAPALLRSVQAHKQNTKV